ncbi:hypothetical protein GQ44DRAFT_772696 [Phaeosphaeriaceae sp. PMI808]|nr:hypothetical protein GQ44DRAFT_772696 [Phaeosphaeriaceae sp. PMI808]
MPVQRSHIVKLRVNKVAFKEMMPAQRSNIVKLRVNKVAFREMMPEPVGVGGVQFNAQLQATASNNQTVAVIPIALKKFRRKLVPAQLQPYISQGDVQPGPSSNKRLKRSHGFTTESPMRHDYEIEQKCKDFTENSHRQKQELQAAINTTKIKDEEIDALKNEIKALKAELLHHTTCEDEMQGLKEENATLSCMIERGNNALQDKGIELSASKANEGKLRQQVEELTDNNQRLNYYNSFMERTMDAQLDETTEGQ